MANHWKGTTDPSFDTAANWSTGSVPANGESWQMDDRAAGNSCLTGMNQAAKTFSSVTLRNFTGNLGASGDPLLMNCTNLFGHGSLARQCYINGTLTNVFADLGNNIETGFVLDSLTVDLEVLRGWVVMTGTRTQAASSRWTLAGGANIEFARLDIKQDQDLTTNNTIVEVMGGRCRLYTACDDARLRSGELILHEHSDGTGAALALLEQSGGVFQWYGNGTIAQANLLNGAFACSIEHNVSRTLTNMTMRGNATADFRMATNMTFSNAIKVYGRNGPLVQPGLTMQPA